MWLCKSLKKEEEKEREERKIDKCPKERNKKENE
jgi:hypothetical protein